MDVHLRWAGADFPLSCATFISLSTLLFSYVLESLRRCKRENKKRDRMLNTEGTGWDMENWTKGGKTQNSTRRQVTLILLFWRGWHFCLQVHRNNNICSTMFLISPSQNFIFQSFHGFTSLIIYYEINRNQSCCFTAVHKLNIASRITIIREGM